MLTQAQKDSIVYQSQVALGDLAYQIACKEEIGTPCRDLYDRAYCITAYLQALQVNTNALDNKEEEKIYECLRELSGKFDFPIAPSLANPNSFPSIVVAPVACCAGAGGGGPGGQEVYQFADIAERDAAVVASPALAFVVDAQADPLVNRPIWAIYFLDDMSTWVPVATQEDVLYSTQLVDTLAMPSPVGGLPAGTLVSDLRDRSHTSLFDDLLFPTVLASVQTPKSATVTYTPAASPVEVGTLINATVTGVFNQGQIENGDTSLGPALVGIPIQYTFTGPGIVGSTVVVSGALVEVINPPAFNAVFGSNQYQVDVLHNAGAGAYFDNKGNPGTNLDGLRIAGNALDSSNVVTGRYNIFYGNGILASNSAEVRGLANATLLNGSNEGNVNLFVPQGQTQQSIAVPAGKTVTILLVESSNADITGAFTVNTFNVNDAGGTPVSYDVYTLNNAVPYGTDVNYDITVS